MSDKRRVTGDLYGSRIRLIIMELHDFYEPREALQWIMEPQSFFNGEKPADLILTDDGTSKVRSVIARLKDGAYV